MAAWKRWGCQPTFDRLLPARLAVPTYRDVIVEPERLAGGVDRLALADGRRLHWRSVGDVHNQLTVEAGGEDLLNGRGEDDDPDLGVVGDAVDCGMELLPEAGC